MKIFKISNTSDFSELCGIIKPQKHGQEIMKTKAKLNYIFLKNIKNPAANILKQDALSIGAELVSTHSAILGGTDENNALLIANDKQLALLAKKEKIQDFKLKELANFLDEYLKQNNAPKPEIMGVLNFNDDSLYESSRTKTSELLSKCEQMINDGATYIDIGAVSSRPGSVYIGAEAEFARIKPIIDLLYQEKIFERVKLSLDSFDDKCLNYALERGFGLVNDISADLNLANLAKKHGASYCLMHKIGQPENMQENIEQKSRGRDILEIVDDFFALNLAKLKQMGIKNIILDIGIGFGKSAHENMVLIKHLEHFLRFNYPLLVGASRKSVINAYFPSSPSWRLAGSLFLHQQAVQNGASIIRTHDVYEHAQTLAMQTALNKIVF